MVIRDALFAGRLPDVPDGVPIALDPGFQGLPDMAHGGSVLALFDALAGRSGARRVRGHYMKRVPLGTDLALARTAHAGALHLALADASGTTLVDGLVAVVPPPAVARPRWTGGGERLPVTTSCFACGTGNEIGLRATLGFDDAGVGGVWQPRERFRAADGALAPIALTALLDEAAFWLGALATGESGMTTEIEVTLLRPVPFGEAVTIVGDRACVARRAADPRYVDTEIVACGADGVPVATAHITFVAVRGAARRLARWLAPTNPPEVIRRVFRD